MPTADRGHSWVKFPDYKTVTNQSQQLGREKDFKTYHWEGGGSGGLKRTLELQLGSDGGGKRGG